MTSGNQLATADGSIMRPFATYVHAAHTHTHTHTRTRTHTHTHTRTRTRTHTHTQQMMGYDTHTPRLTALFWDYPGEPVPER